MKLKVLTPVEVVLEKQVRGVVAEGSNGHFGLKPRHIDFVSDLVAGLLYFQTGEDPSQGEYLAVNRGILVKRGEEVLVSTHDAIGGVPLEDLVKTVTTRFGAMDERQRAVRSAMARLEADFLRRFMELP